MKPFGRSAASRKGCSGTVLMEAVVCLPVILLLVTGIWQFARIWEARFFTWLAAYNAARATLVYNPRDYAWRTEGGQKQVVDDDAKECRVEEDEGTWVFYENRGVAWLAAVNTLAWISQTEGEEEDWYPFPRFKSVPYSSRIKEQVRIVSALDPEILASRLDPFSPPDLRYSTETSGVVRVSVGFKLPLILSVFDPSFLWGGDTKTLSEFTGVEPDDARARAEKRLGRTFELRETVALPKPWSTERYPVVSMAERLHLLDAAGADLSDGLSFDAGNASGLWSNGKDGL